MKGSRRGAHRRAQRWSAAEAGAVLSRLERSGESVARFALECGIGVERLYRWRRRLGEQSRSKAEKLRFAEIALSTSADIEMALPGGIALHFTGSSRVEDALAILTRLPKA